MKSDPYTKEHVMPKFLVCLEIRLKGAPCGSTSDEIEAPDADAAEKQAIAAWRKADPTKTYGSLWTQQLA